MNLEFVETKDGVMIYPGHILTEIFGNVASAQIIKHLGGTIRQNTLSKLPLNVFLNFAADPHPSLTLWKTPSWKDFNRGHCIAKLRAVGIVVIDAKLNFGNVKQRTVRPFNTLPEVMMKLNSEDEFDIEAFARSAHNVFEQHDEAYEQADAEMVTQNAHGRSSASSSFTSSAPPRSPDLESFARQGQRRIAWTRQECADYLGTMNIDSPLNGTISIAMQFFNTCSGNLNVLQRDFLQPILQYYLQEKETARQIELLNHQKELAEAKHEVELQKEKVKTEQETTKAKVAEAKLSVFQQFCAFGSVPPRSSAPTSDDEMKATASEPPSDTNDLEPDPSGEILSEADRPKPASERSENVNQEQAAVPIKDASPMQARVPSSKSTKVGDLPQGVKRKDPEPKTASNPIAESSDKFNEVVSLVCSSMKECLQYDPVKIDLCVREIPCVHESADILAEMITKGLRIEKNLLVIEAKCKIVSPGELIIFKRECDEDIENWRLVNADFLNQSLRNNVHLMNSDEWRYVAFIVKTETSLQVQFWKVIQKNRVLAIRPDDDLAELVDNAYEYAMTYKHRGLYDICLSMPYRILAFENLSFYEVPVFMSALQRKLKDAGFTIEIRTGKPYSTMELLTTEDISLLKQDDHYTMHAYVCQRIPQVWMRFQLNEAGEAILLGSRHEKALAAHRVHPMATNLLNLEQNQLVYFNIGYRGIPIPPVVGVSDTCLVMERLKHENKVFYKFQHIATALPADGQFTTTFLLHIKQVPKMASLMPLSGGHGAHTKYKKGSKYSEAGVAALRESK